jgi:YfiH family protein
MAEPEILPALGHIPGLRAFFTTRRGGVSQGAHASLNLSIHTGDDPERVKENWTRLLTTQGLADKRLAIPELCHGAEAREVGDPEAASAARPAALENVDAVYTRDPRWVLAVTMGDCLAALVADAETGCLAAVHAGWRGSRANILGKTLERLFASGHCRPASTFVALGPCLSAEALEIGAETAASLPEPHLRQEQGRHFFDLRACNRGQAEAAGALPGNISAVPGCTRTDSHLFFSYRRDGARSGRMAACIAWL